MTFDPTCWSCLANAGIKRVSPGVTIYEGQHWLVEHAYPTKLRGWLVLVLKEHKAALHELTPAEFAEMGELIQRTIRLVHRQFHSAKEYVMILAEAEHFHHVHVHVVPRAADLPSELRGPRIFALLGEKVSAEAIPPAEIAALCEELRAAFPRDDNS